MATMDKLYRLWLYICQSMRIRLGRTLPFDSDQEFSTTIDARYAMAPRKRGGPAQPVGGNYSTRYYTGVSAAPKATAIIPEAVEDPAESPAGTASVEEESGAFHQLASEIETPADIDSPTLPAIAPPAIVPPAVVENADSGTVNAALSPMDEAVSASASLIGSV